MSNIPANIVPVLEPRIAFFEKTSVQGQYALVKGAETYTYRNYPSNSCSNSNINWSTPSPSFEDVLSRVCVIEVPLNIQFSGPGSANPDEAMIQSNLDAFRAYPLESIIKSIQVMINGEVFTCNMSQIVHPFSRYHLGVEDFNKGITPNMLDFYQSYQDGNGNSKNPLAWYDNSAQNPRGAYADYTIVTNTNTTAEIQAVLRTYVMMSPFQWIGANKSNVPGLTQITSLDWEVNFSSNLSRIWSRSATHPVPVSNMIVTIGSLTGQGSGNANMRLLWCTPRASMRQYISSLPEIKYPYFSTNRLSTPGDSALAPNASTTITSQVINLISIPNAIYIYAIQDESTVFNNLQTNLTVTDTYFSIENIDITLANVTGILSTASPQQLYDISIRGGLKDTTFNEFVGYTNPFNQLVSTFDATKKIGLVGSVVRLTPGVDFSLRDDLCAGVGNEKIDMQVKVQVRNINQYNDVKPMLCILCVYEGYMTVYNGQCRKNIGVLTRADVVASNDYQHIDWNDLEKNYGGSIGDRFGLFVRDVAPKINKFLKDSKAISKGLKVASYAPTRFSSGLDAASKVAKHYGYGEGGMLMEEQRGGRAVSHNKLKSRLKTRK